MKIYTQKLFLKPHHFLDIIKLHGFGVKRFKPDKKYGHDFYKIGNIILENPETLVWLTIGADDICKPCRFLKNGKCVDLSSDLNLSKQKWNKRIDRRILKSLDLVDEDGVIVFKLCGMALERLTSRKIAEIWKERPASETEKRIDNLQNGLRKYIQRRVFLTTCRKL